MHRRIAHELCWCIKPHGLRIEHRRAEYIRIMPLDPGRYIDELREARCVTHGEAVIREALDLVKAALGEIAHIAALDHPINEFLAKYRDRAAALERRHCPAKPIGIFWRKARRDDSNLHRLFLEQWYA